MAKNKTAYVCSECGADFSRWQGQCSECKEWNTITEVRLGVTTPGKSARYTGYAGAIGSQVQTLAEVATTEGLVEEGGEIVAGRGKGVGH